MHFASDFSLIFAMEFLETHIEYDGIKCKINALYKNFFLQACGTFFAPVFSLRSVMKTNEFFRTLARTPREENKIKYLSDRHLNKLNCEINFYVAAKTSETKKTVLATYILH